MDFAHNYNITMNNSRLIEDIKSSLDISDIIGQFSVTKNAAGLVWVVSFSR